MSLLEGGGSDMQEEDIEDQNIGGTKRAGVRPTSGDAKALSQHKASGKSKMKRTADAAGTIKNINKENIMNKFLFIPESQSKLLVKYKRIKTGFVPVVFKLYEDVNKILWKIHKDGWNTVTPQEIEEIFEDFMVEFIKYFPDVINLGQKLSGKSHGVMLCFAIAECIDHIGTQLGSHPDHYFDKMDLDEVCLQFFIKHTFYSHMLDGETDPERFNTAMARKVFEKYFDIFDAIVLCCKGTTANPEGNKWSVMMKQLKSNNGGISDDQDLMSLWWLVANLMSDLRALHYHVKTGEQYTLMAASIRNMKKCHENENGDVLESPIIKILISPHPQAAITSLPNRISHPIWRVMKYADHFHQFLAFLANVDEFEGVKLNPPTIEQCTYFFRRGKLPGYTDSTPEEQAALEEALFILYILPHLYKLRRRRANQLDHEWNVLRRLAAVVVRAHDTAKLSNVDETTFSDDTDRSNFKALSVKHGGDDVVSTMLVEVRKQLLKLYEGSTLEEINELRRLAAVVVRAYDTAKLSNVDENTFSNDRDKSSFKALSAKYKGDDKVSAKLIATRNQNLEQYEGSKLAELNELKHLASVVTKYCHANGISMNSFSCDMLTDDEDGEIGELYLKHQTLHGGDEQLTTKLTQVRQEWESSALAEHLDLKKLARAAAEKVVDANLLTSPSSLSIDLFTGEDRQTFNRLFTQYGQDQEVLFDKFVPFLATYQGTCEGIPPIHSDLRARPCGKDYSSRNPRQILGMRSDNRGHCFTGLPFCDSCRIDIDRKYPYYEQHLLELKEEDPNQDFSQQQYARLKRHQPHKAVRQFGVYFTTHKATIESNTRIVFGLCTRTTLPKVNSLTLNNNNNDDDDSDADDNNNNRVMLAENHRIFSIGGRDTTTISSIEHVKEIFSDECNKSKRVLIQFGSLIAKSEVTTRGMKYYIYQEKTRTVEIGETAGIRIKLKSKIRDYDLSSDCWLVTKVDTENNSIFEKDDMILSIDSDDVSGLIESEVISLVANLERRRVFKVLTWVQQS